MGSTTGSVAGGTLEAGYQIGCGVEMDKVSSTANSRSTRSLSGYTPTAATPSGSATPRPASTASSRWSPCPAPSPTSPSTRSRSGDVGRIPQATSTSRSTTASGPRRCARMRCSPVRAPTPTTSSPTTARRQGVLTRHGPTPQILLAAIGVTVAVSGIFIAGATLLFANTAAAEPATPPRNRVTPLRRLPIPAALTADDAVLELHVAG